MAEKFIDLGEKMGGGEVAAPSAEKKNQVYYPSFSIRDNESLELDASLAGKEIEAVVKLKVVSIEKRATDKGKKDCASFDVLGIKFQNLPKKNLQEKIQEGLEGETK